jgi:ABC-type phosphate transport system substrate-binding protein
MNVRVIVALLCGTAPLALSAQQVSLTSPDEFISVDGEIVGFNGVMLRVETIVGPVSVPASEVICYGEACLDVLANNDFGLTADQLAGVVATSAEVGASPAPSRELTIAFASSAGSAIYTSLAAGVEGAQASGTAVSLSGGTSLTVTDDLTSADVVVRTVSLEGVADAIATGPAGWASGTEALTHQMLGVDALAVQMSPSTGLSSISLDDLSRIFAGEVTNWSQIGGANQSVLALRLPDDALLSRDLSSVLMAPAGREVSNTVLVMGDEASIAASVNQFPGSVAVVSNASAIPELTVPVTGTCGLAVAPTPFTIASGDYPLLRPVMASYNVAPGPDLVDLFDAAASSGSQPDGLIDYSAVVQDASIKNMRLNGLMSATLDDSQRVSAAAMFEALLPAQRLSTTFIGGTVSGPEGGWNRAMMVDLIEALAEPQFANREILFVGFGSGDAGPQAALAASTQAASDVQAAFQSLAAGLVADAGLRLTSVGFGDIAPATCIDGQASGDDATRVEVWVR